MRGFWIGITIGLISVTIVVGVGLLAKLFKAKEMYEWIAAALVEYGESEFKRGWDANTLIPFDLELKIRHAALEEAAKIAETLVKTPTSVDAIMRHRNEQMEFTAEQIRARMEKDAREK
jgi:hypothetical protein